MRDARSEDDVVGGGGGGNGGGAGTGEMGTSTMGASVSTSPPAGSSFAAGSIITLLFCVSDYPVEEPRRKIFSMRSQAIASVFGYI